MTIFQAIILGIVQGLAEMLPISSSAHLVLVPWVFGFSDPGLAFDVALHLGTLVAILAFFWRDWFGILNNLILILKTRKITTFEQKLAGFIIVASAPGAIFGVLLEKDAETIFRSPLLIAATLVIFALILDWADRQDKEKRDLEKMTTVDSLKIGLSQALALIPGVSRSGITMTTGLLAGFKKEDVAKFSFLMSAPIIAGAGLVKLKDLPISELLSPTFTLGFLAAAISSLLAIAFLLAYVKKHGFKIFVYYRYLLAAIILILFFFRR